VNVPVTEVVLIEESVLTTSVESPDTVEGKMTVPAKVEKLPTRPVIVPAFRVFVLSEPACSKPEVLIEPACTRPVASRVTVMMSLLFTILLLVIILRLAVVAVALLVRVTLLPKMFLAFTILLVFASMVETAG
jgi:hypothetical protein